MQALSGAEPPLETEELDSDTYDAAADIEVLAREPEKGHAAASETCEARDLNPTLTHICAAADSCMYSADSLQHIPVTDTFTPPHTPHPTPHHNMGRVTSLFWCR